MESPKISINIDGEHHSMTWDNTSMFLHKDDFYDHIYICKGEDIGAFILKLANPEQFEVVADLLYENEFPYHFAPEPSEHDRRIIDRHIQEEIQIDIEKLQNES